jgi:hypothetical protein
LAGFEARVGFADYVDSTATAYDLAVRMAVFERLDGRDYFHGEKQRRMNFPEGLSTDFPVLPATKLDFAIKPAILTEN